MTAQRPRVIMESWPSFCVTGAVGLRAVRYCGTRFFGYLYIIILLVCYYVLTYFSINYFDEIYEDLELITTSIKPRCIIGVLNLVIFPLTIIVSTFKFDRAKSALTELDEVDRKLKIFNVPMTYSKWQRQEMINIFGVILFTLLMALTEYFSFVNDVSNYKYGIIWTVTQFPQFVTAIALSTFVVMMKKICNRQQIINKLILDLKNSTKNQNESVLSVDVNNVYKIKLLIEAYKYIGKIIFYINQAFGIVLLISLAKYLIFMCAHMYIVYQTYGSKDNAVDFIVDLEWTMFYLGKFLYVTQASNASQQQAKWCRQLLRECQVDSDHHLLKQEVESFAVQVENTDIQITASDFFTVNYSLLLKVVLALMAYVFFLSQRGIPT